MDKKTLDLLTERGLASHMNNTKWRELCEAVDGLPFAPPYQVKLLRDPEPYPVTFDYAPSYLGDWAKTFEARLDEQVEWIKVAPRYRTNGVRLFDPVINNCSGQFRSILKRLRVPYVEADGLFTIYGHAGPIAFDTQ